MNICQKITSAFMIAVMLLGSGFGVFAAETGYTSVHETEAEAVALLEDDTVFMTNCERYFAGGERHNNPEVIASAWHTDMSAWKEGMTTEEAATTLGFDAINSWQGQDDLHQERVVTVERKTDVPYTTAGDVAVAFVMDDTYKEWVPNVSSGLVKSFSATEGVVDIGFDVYVQQKQRVALNLIELTDSKGKTQTLTFSAHTVNNESKPQYNWGYNGGMARVTLTYSPTTGRCTATVSETQIGTEGGASALDKTQDFSAQIEGLCDLAQIKFVAPVLYGWMAYDNISIENRLPSQETMEKDGVFMATTGLLSKALQTEIQVVDNQIHAHGKTAQIGSKNVAGETLEVAPVRLNGAVYVPVASFAKVMLERYVYEDERGMILISNENRVYSNSAFGKDNFEPIDIIYRYMQYERPDGDTLYQTIQTYSKGEYPRTLVKRSDLPALRQRIASDTELSEALRSLRATCDGYLNQEVVAYERPDGLRLFEAANSASVRLRSLGALYLITQEAKYADRMWLELKNVVLDWPDWNVNKHFLDSGRLAPGVAFAYDVLHDYLTDEQRQNLREKIDSLYLDAAVNCFDGSGLYLDAKNYRLTQHNWGAVCASGMLMMSMVLMDEEAEGSDFNKKCKFIAENAVQSLEYPLGMFFPDGPTGEGVQYWDFYVEHIAFSIETLMNMCGDDYDMLSTPGYRTTPEFIMHIQTKEGWYNHSSTMGQGPFWNGAVYHIADRFHDADAMAAYEQRRKMLGQKMDVNSLLWYNPQGGNAVAEPLDKHFGGEDIVTMHGSWASDEASFMAMRAGYMHQHCHYDKGSFIYDNGGVRWFEDLGPEQYNIEGGYDAIGGATLYRVRAEGHNNLVINPTAQNPGQKLGGTAVVERFETKPRGAIAVTDLTSLYDDSVKTYRRGFYMGDDRETLTVQDELELLTDNSQIYYFLHTKGEIVLDNDGRGATIFKDNKALKVEILCDASDWQLSVSEEENLFSENDRNGETDRSEYSKLVLSGYAGGRLTISARFSLINATTYPAHAVRSINSWQLPEGEIMESPYLRDLNRAYLSTEAVSFDVVLPEEYQTAKVLCNGETLASLTQTESGSLYRCHIDGHSLPLGENQLVVSVSGEQNEKTIHQSFSLFPGQGGYSWKQNMSALRAGMTPTEIAAALGVNSVSGSTDANGQKTHPNLVQGLSGYDEDIALAFVANSDNTAWSQGYPQLVKNVSARSGMVRIYFDVYVEDLANPGYLYLKGTDASGRAATNHFFFTDGDCDKSGHYAIEVAYNLDEGSYSVICNGRTIAVPPASAGYSLTPLRTISSVNFVGPVYRPGTYVAFDNLEILQYQPTAVSVTESGVAVENLKNGSYILAIAGYHNQQLIDCVFFPVVGDTAIRFDERDDFEWESADLIKAFLWTGRDSLKPVCQSAWKKLLP